MLPDSQFLAALESLPLVSIDLCLVDPQQRLLLGKRLNRPARGWWFTPGGRIRKNEPWQQAFSRIASEELGLTVTGELDAQLMGIWDHFYQDSALDENVSTHYVNLPHFIKLSQYQADNLALPHDEQHGEYCWIGLEEVIQHENVHEYVKKYAHWIKEQ